MGKDIIELIKKEYPWAIVVRIDLAKNGSKSLWIYEREAVLKKQEAGCSVSWYASGEANELHPFGIFAPLLGATGADPATWELRLD